MATDSAPWLAALRRYTVASALGHITWETLQLPLYKIWFEGTVSQIAFAVVHCTGGDMLIAAATIFTALLLFGQRWPTERAAYRNVALVAILLGVAVVVYSEWLNVNVRGTWAYSPWMPQLPPLGTGLSPLVQWLIVPSIAFLWTRSWLVGWSLFAYKKRLVRCISISSEAQRPKIERNQDVVKTEPSIAMHEANTMLPHGHARLPVFVLGLSASLFIAITYILCVGFDLMFPSHAMYTAWAPMLPGFTWLTWQSFMLGLIESLAYGWYVALIFGPLFNCFAKWWK